MESKLRKRNLASSTAVDENQAGCNCSVFALHKLPFSMLSSRPSVTEAFYDFISASLIG